MKGHAFTHSEVDNSKILHFCEFKTVGNCINKYVIVSFLK
jgi:hypothetical protein